MPRLVSVQTGAVVSCSDEIAARLGSGWEDADMAAVKPTEKSAPAKKVVPAKKAAVKPTEKSAPAKKVVPAKKAAVKPTEK